MNQNEKLIIVANKIIDAIKEAKYISKTDKKLAVMDLNRMLNDICYAGKVCFKAKDNVLNYSPRESLACLFIWGYSSLGSLFWLNISKNIE